MPWAGGSHERMHTSARRRAEGEPVADFATDTEEEKRERDLRMLTGLLECELTEKEHEAFTDMHERLTAGVWRLLTRDQRSWAEDACKRYDVATEPPKPVPRGREVEPPDVLRNLPKKPPGRL